MAEFIAASIFIAGYLAISLEHRIFVNKAAASLLLAVLLWVVASITLPIDIVRNNLTEAGSDIFGLVIFLLTAMTLVEILVHYHLFDVLERWLRLKGWTTYKMGWAIVVLTFFGSAILDDLTTTIVSIQISRRLFPSKAILIIAPLLVIAANAGGAFSPVGDVTTLMLWFAEKFSATEVITQAFLPSVVMTVIPSFLILKTLKKSPALDTSCDHNFRLSRSDSAIIIATLSTFLLPLVAKAMGLPPYLGLLAGLGFIWTLIDFAKQARPQETHLKAHIRTLLQKTDIESLQFFVGILLAVSALHSLGILDQLTSSILGESPTFTRTVTAFVSFGISSAVVDNVPLTAALISALGEVSSTLWVVLAICVGVGGSLLVIGSAAGVIAMGMLPELTYTKYLKTATIPALLGFVASISVWLLQYQLFL